MGPRLRGPGAGRLPPGRDPDLGGARLALPRRVKSFGERGFFLFLHLFFFRVFPLVLKNFREKNEKISKSQARQEPLRRPHLYHARPEDPRTVRAAQAQRDAGGVRGQERAARGRLDRPRVRRFF